MTDVIGREAETFTATDLPIENHLPPTPSLVRSIGNMAAGVARRTLLPLAGIAAGAYFTLHGAQYDTDIEGTHVSVSTDITTHDTGIHTEVIIQDPPLQPQSLGGVDFPEFLSPLPLRIEARAYPGPPQVDQTITGRYAYINRVRAEAEEKAQDAAWHFADLAALGVTGGLGGGLLLSESIEAALRNRRLASTGPNEQHALLKSLGHSGLALAVITAGGIYGAGEVHPHLSHYSGYGAIGKAMSTPGELTSVNLKSPVLDQIFEDFRQKNRCPETAVPKEQPYGSVTMTTYNIRSGTFSSYGAEGIADELAKSKSDVIFLQEVTPDVLTVLANKLGMQAITGWTIKNDKLTFGNAILTKFPVLYTEYISLPAHGQEPRGVLAVELKSPINGKPFLVADEHLTQELLTSHGDAREYIRDDEANAAVKRLLQIRHSDEALILAGDINTHVGGPAYGIFRTKFDDLVAQQLGDQSTFPANGLRFDNIFIQANSGWKTLSAARGGADMSDHCSVTAEVKMSTQYVTISEAAQLSNPAAIPRSLPR